MTADVSRNRERSAEDPVAVLQRIYPELLTMATSLVGRDAEDAVQDALVEVLARHPAFKGLESPLAYSKVVLARSAFGRWRQPKPPSELSDALTDEHTPDIADNIALRHAILGALHDLPRRQRVCVYLRFVEVSTTAR